MNIENRIGRWSVILGIVIVLNLFFNYTISLVYDRPDYEDFCPTSQVVVIPDTQDECIAEGGQWTQYQNKFGTGQAPMPVGELVREGYCDLQYTCRQEFENANDTYNRNVFVVLVVLGALAVLVGNFFRGNTVITGGLSLAGLFSFIIASMRYWGSAGNLARVLILAIALGILFWIAIKKFSSKE